MCAHSGEHLETLHGVAERFSFLRDAIRLLCLGEPFFLGVVIRRNGLKAASCVRSSVVAWVSTLDQDFDALSV